METCIFPMYAKRCCAVRWLWFQADILLQTGRARALMGDWDDALAALEQVGPRNMYRTDQFTCVHHQLRRHLRGGSVDKICAVNP